MLIPVFLAVSFAHILVSGNSVTVRGKINFLGGPPTHIPDGSTLSAKLQDTSMMDAPAIDLGTVVHKIQNYTMGKDLTFEIKDAARPIYDLKASIAAVINVGWTPNDDEWIRVGDYLNDMMHHVHMANNKNEYENVVINLRKYT